MARPKGSLTGSKRFNKPTADTINPLEIISDIASDVQNVVSATQSVTYTTTSLGKGARSIKNSFEGGSEFVTADIKTSLDRASGIASQYGASEIQINELLGTDPYKADANIPELKAADANREKLKIQRQNNALDVRLETIKQGRKVASVASEQRRLVGDWVDFSTVGIETASKVIKNQVAGTKYRIDQSKLEQTEELLWQQQITTQGTLNLTEGIRQEWSLKFENQQAKNTRLQLEIEGTIQETDRKREEMESRILEG